MKLFYDGNGIEITEFKSFFSRFKGFMFKKNIKDALLFNRCNSIHTFFMLENIDVLLLDKNNRILMINRNVKPNKVLIFNNKNKTNILELPNNSSINLKVNDIIDINNLNI